MSLFDSIKKLFGGEGSATDVDMGAETPVTPEVPAEPQATEPTEPEITPEPELTPEPEAPVVEEPTPEQI